MIANRRKREKKSSVFLLFFFLFFNFFFVFVSCAFFFSRLLVEFCLEASRQTPKWKSVLREFLYVRLLYSITSFWTCDDDYDDYDVCKVPSSYRQLGGRGQLLSRRYCTHSGWLFSCAHRTASRPKALWRFRASTSNSLSGRSWPHTHTHFAIFIILTLNKIFEYVEMTICSRPRGSPRIPRRFDFFA